MSKSDDGVDAWRLQKTFDGVTFRVNITDKEAGSKQRGFTLAASLLHLLNRLLPKFQLSYEGKEVSRRNSRRVTDVPEEFVDREAINGLVFGY